MEIPLDNDNVTMALNQKSVTIYFASREDAEKFYITVHEAARSGAKVSFKPVGEDTHAKRS